MSYENTPFEGVEDSEYYDPELAAIIEKIDEINESDEDDQQQELIELCDTAIERFGRSEIENVELLDYLYWSAGYAYLELAEEGVPIEKGLRYINLIRNRFIHWHLAYARIHFYRENFIETLEHLDLLEKMIVTGIKNETLDRDSSEEFRQICAIGRMRTYIATKELKKYDACFSDYLAMIAKDGILTRLNHYSVPEDLILFHSNVDHFISLLAIEDEFGSTLGIQESLKSQISFLRGNILESNRYAYEAKKNVTEGDNFEIDFWKMVLEEENDTEKSYLSISAFICPQLDDSPGAYSLMEERSERYVDSNDAISEGPSYPELDKILIKIEEINDTEEEGRQKELIGLCDSAIDLAMSNQLENEHIFANLYWSAGFAYLELAQEDVTLIELALKYLDEIPESSPQWHLTMARIIFFKENFNEALKHLELCKKMIMKDEATGAMDIDTGQILKEMCQQALMKTSFMCGDEERFKTSFTAYINMIRENENFGQLIFMDVVNLLVSVSKSSKRLNSLLDFVITEKGILAMFFTETLLKSQISFLDGNFEDSNKYAYTYKDRLISAINEDDGTGYLSWNKMIDDEIKPNFNLERFECKSSVDVQKSIRLMESRATQYSKDNNLPQAVLRDKEVGLNFPEKLANFNFQYLQYYEEEGLGYSLRYGDEATVRIELYVYGNTEDDIEDGITSQKVLDEFGQFHSSISYMVTEGNYKNATKQNSEEQSFCDGAIRFLWSQVQYEIVPSDNIHFIGNVISSIYLTALRGKLIKIRLTIKKEAQIEIEDDIEAFMTAFWRILKER